MDGKLLPVSNVPDDTPVQVVRRYKSLADIERGFRVLKSEIEIAPVHHRLPQRIRVHAMLWFYCADCLSRNAPTLATCQKRSFTRKSLGPIAPGTAS